MVKTVFQAHYQSPIGTLCVEGVEEGIRSISFSDEKPTTHPRIDSSVHPHLRDCILQLDEYFFSDRRAFHSLPLHFGATDFQSAVWDVLLHVPYGETVSYAELAMNAGHPGAARAVGTAMRVNPLPIIIPCHRVLPSSGELGHYTPGPQRKRWLLTHEGVSDTPSF